MAGPERSVPIFIAFDAENAHDDRRRYGREARAHASRESKARLRNKTSGGLNPKPECMRRHLSAPTVPSQSSLRPAIVDKQTRSRSLSSGRRITIWPQLPYTPSSTPIHLRPKTQESWAVHNAPSTVEAIEDDLNHLFEAFCRHESVFDGMRYFRLWLKHHISAATPEEISEMSVLAIKVAQQLRTKLQDLPDDELEPTLLTMSLMLRDYGDVEAKTLSPAKPLFDPHMPWAEAVMAVRAGAGEGFYSAASHLVARAGGLQALKYPYLARSLCLIDLQHSINEFATPRFPNNFAIDPAFWSRFATTNGVDAVGGAFDDLQSLGIPKRAIQTWTRLGVLNSIMTRSRDNQTSETDFFHLMDARNSIHYELLSLPPCPCENDVELFTVYECCRLAALLYANHVIRPALPHSKGLLIPIGQLNTVFQNSMGMRSSQVTNAMLIWVLVVAAMSSYGLESYDYFISRLAVISHRASISTIEGVTAILKRFVWSDEAGGAGLKRVWGATQFTRALLPESELGSP